jgi:hypothetical protein
MSLARKRKRKKRKECFPKFLTLQAAAEPEKSQDLAWSSALVAVLAPLVELVVELAGHGDVGHDDGVEGAGGVTGLLAGVAAGVVLVLARGAGGLPGHAAGGHGDGALVGGGGGGGAEVEASSAQGSDDDTTEDHNLRVALRLLLELLGALARHAAGSGGEESTGDLGGHCCGVEGGYVAEMGRWEKVLMRCCEALFCCNGARLV